MKKLLLLTTSIFFVSQMAFSQGQAKESPVLSSEQDRSEAPTGQPSTIVKSKVEGSYTVPHSNVLINETNVNQVTIPLNTTTHFVSPEAISYVDISSPNIQGDLPEKNIFRLKPDLNKMVPGDQFIVTIVTNFYVAVYNLTIADENTRDGAYVISVNPNNAVQLNQINVLNNQQLFDFAIKAMKKKRKIRDIENKEYGMKLFVNNIFTFGDYIMIDLGAQNKTNIQFDVDQIRFKIVDKRTVKASVSQDIEIHPIYSLNTTDGQIITNKWSNFYVFKKFTYPSQKLFQIELTEEQYSGRKVSLTIDYNQILQSRQLN